MSQEVTQDLMIVVGNAIGITILVILLVYVHRMSDKVQQIQKQIELLDKARDKRAKKEK